MPYSAAIMRSVSYEGHDETVGKLEEEQAELTRAHTARLTADQSLATRSKTTFCENKESTRRRLIIFVNAYERRKATLLMSETHASKFSAIPIPTMLKWRN